MKGTEQAFPSTFRFESDGIEGGGTHTGITKREYFAAQAMQGLLAGQYQIESKSKGLLETNSENIANTAFEQADAMLKVK